MQTRQSKRPKNYRTLQEELLQVTGTVLAVRMDDQGEQDLMMIEADATTLEGHTWHRPTRKCRTLPD